MGDLDLKLAGIRLDGQTRCPPRRAGGEGMHDDARIERDDAFGVDQQRIDVELGDFVDVGDQSRYANHDFAHRLTCGRRPIAVAAQQPVDARAAERVLGQDQIERRQGQGLVVDHLCRDAAMSDHQDRPEYRILGRADDQFHRVRPPHHRLDDETVDRALGRGGDRPCRSSPSTASSTACSGAEIERHAADVGLVGDLARQDLDDDRKADAPAAAAPPRRHRARPRSARRECRRQPARAWTRARSAGSRPSASAPRTIARTSSVSDRTVGIDGGVRCSARWPRRYCDDMHEAAHGAQRRVVGRRCPASCSTRRPASASGPPIQQPITGTLLRAGARPRRPAPPPPTR